jgi:hypothetical protein
VWSTGIIGGCSGGGVRSGDKTDESIAEWLPRKKRFINIYVWKLKIFSQDNVSQLSFLQFDDQTMTGHS